MIIMPVLKTLVLLQLDAFSRIFLINAFLMINAMTLIVIKITDA